MDIKTVVRLVFVGAWFFGAACAAVGPPKDRIHLYMLEYQAPAPEGLEPVGAALKVERFTVAPAYNSREIVYRDRAYERNAYAYHKWRANPGDLVMQVLTRDMRQSGLFRAVYPPESTQASTHVLEGRVEEILEWDHEDTWSGVLTIGVTLIEKSESDVLGRVLFQRSYRSEKPCTDRNPKALVEALSLGMEEISRRLLRDIHSHLAHRGDP